MKRTTYTVLVAAIAIAASACAGPNGTSSTAPTAPSSPAPSTSPAPSPTVMNVTVSGAASVGSFQLVAVAERSDHTTENATTGAAWVSSNPGVARVAAGGWVTVVEDGDVDFAATYQGVTGTLRATVSMPKKYTIAGVVTDAATGAPLSNVRVQVLDADLQTTTDAHGSYSLAHVPSGRSFVEFAATGYDVKERDVSIAGDITLSVALSATDEP